jgi:signal peptidase I
MAFYGKSPDQVQVRDRPLALALLPLTLILVVAVSMFLVFFTSYGVVGDSMEPTLLPGDRLFVTRDYDAPSRGDLVLAHVVVEGVDETHIKRVVAVPGDEVVVEGDTIWVNGEVAAGDTAIVYFDRPVLEPLVVPAGHVFVAGDNRPVSLDSRQLGTVSLDRVEGRAVAIFLPIGRMGGID